MQYISLFRILGVLVSMDPCESSYILPEIIWRFPGGNCKWLVLEESWVILSISKWWTGTLTSHALTQRYSLFHYFNRGSCYSPGIVCSKSIVSSRFSRHNPSIEPGVQTLREDSCPVRVDDDGYRSLVLIHLPPGTSNTAPQKMNRSAKNI